MTDHIDTSALRKLAEAATPGPWRIKGRTHSSGEFIRIESLHPHKHLYQVTDVIAANGYQENQANAAHIAACNPAAILSLLDEVDALRSRAHAGSGAEAMKRCATCTHWQKCEEYETGYAQGVGRCGAVPMFWDMTEWKEVDDDYRREFKPEAEKITAFAQDGSDYSAKLFTRPDHGCTMFAAAPAALHQPKENDE